MTGSTVAGLFEGAVIGSVRMDDACLPVSVAITVRVYHDGDLCIAWHKPGDPLSGGSLTVEAPKVDYVSMWEAWGELMG